MSPSCIATRDQALLTLVVNAANGRQVGRTSLQKIMYFLKASGVEMDYRFDIHHYGPFSDQIVRDTRTLILEDVLIDRSNEPAAFSDYSIGPKARHLIDSHADIPAGVRKLVQEVMDALVSLPPKRLELLSTVHYAFRMLMAGGGAPSKEAVVNQFYEFKEPERFSSIEVVDAFELLMRVGVIRA